MGGTGQFASLHQTFVRVLAFAGQTFQFFRMRGEDGTLRQVGKGMAVVGEDIKSVGIHYNRSLAVFQLLQQGSFRFLVSSQSRADADCLVVVRIGRYGKTGFVDVGFYDCFGYGGLQDVVVAHWCMNSQQPYSRTEAGAGSENRGSCHSF